MGKKEEQPEQASGKSKTELFIRSIPADATNEELTDFFSQVSPVKHAVIVTNSATGESKGFGFVSFADSEDAQAVLDKCRKVKFKGKLLQLEFAKPRTRDHDAVGESKQQEPIEKRRPRLIIRNLPWSIRNTKVLIDNFQKYGKVVDAVIPRGKGGKMSGFAFVTMKKKAHALKAIEGSKDLKLDGRSVVVDFAVEKNKWLGGVKEEVYQESDSESDEQNSSDRENEGTGSISKEDEIIDIEDDSGEKASNANGKVIEDKADEGNADENDEENEYEDVEEAKYEDDDDDEDEDGDEDEDDDEDENKLANSLMEDPSIKKQRPAPNSNTVFVRNIPYDATSESISEHFKQFGPVRYALPVMDKELNRPKGTAFVAFYNQKHCEDCALHAPSFGSASLLIADDIDPKYVFDGRILSVTKAVDRNRAEKLSLSNAEQRLKLLGKEPSEKDKRNIFLLNEGKITSDSQLGASMPSNELEIRQKSYDLRKQQLSKNPSLRISLTRLAVRNLPRSMNEKALKALARNAIVQFAKEVNDGLRKPLTKEEIIRSVKQSGEIRKSKHGVVRQAKIINEQKGSGEEGRSRGYGFVEYRNHKAALMGLRWLNGHAVLKDDILQGYPKDKWEKVDLKDHSRRRLVVEFAIENSQVVKRRKDTQMRVKQAIERRRKETPKSIEDEVTPQERKRSNNELGQIIGKKRKMRKTKT